MKWSDILAMAERVLRGRKIRDGSPDPGKQLARMVLEWQAEMAAGKHALPASWEPAAVHLAGYERSGS